MKLNLLVSEFQSAYTLIDILDDATTSAKNVEMFEDNLDEVRLSLYICKHYAHSMTFTSMIDFTENGAKLLIESLYSSAIAGA